MRTTADLADELLHAIDSLRRRRGVRRDVVINDLLRIGLARMRAPAPEFVQRTYPLGWKKGPR